MCLNTQGDQVAEILPVTPSDLPRSTLRICRPPRYHHQPPCIRMHACSTNYLNRVLGWRIILARNKRWPMQNSTWLYSRRKWWRWPLLVDPDLLPLPPCRSVDPASPSSFPNLLTVSSCSLCAGLPPVCPTRPAAAASWLSPHVLRSMPSHNEAQTRSLR